MSEVIVNDWSDLAHRASDGVAVALEWSRSTGLVRVRVVDLRAGDHFEFAVDGSDALAAIHHPFAFRARQEWGAGTAANDHISLQAQG